MSQEENWISSTRVLRKLQSFPKLFLSNKGPSSQGVYFDKEWGREVCQHLVSFSEKQSTIVFKFINLGARLAWNEPCFSNILGM